MQNFIGWFLCIGIAGILLLGFKIVHGQSADFVSDPVVINPVVQVAAVDDYAKFATSTLAKADQDLIVYNERSNKEIVAQLKITNALLQSLLEK